MALCAPTTHSKLKNLSAVFSNGRRGRRRSSVIVLMASSDVSSSGGGNVAAFEEGQLERPRWTGETPISRLVGALISFKPLFSILKLGARQVLISTAEKTNIPWREMTREVLESEVYKEMESIQDPSLVYPDYYLNPFHAYNEGNLSWLAAAEAEAATMSMVRRAIPYASSLDEANQIVRGNWLQAIEEHHLLHSGNSMIKDILDVGCSVGVSTRFLADKFPSAKVTGLDLSPYFLSVAQFKEKESAPRKNPISWIHANGEATGLPSKSYDLVSLAYVPEDMAKISNTVLPWKAFQYNYASDSLKIILQLHECPTRAIVGLLREAFRILRPGGTIALTDNSPKSKILQELSPVLFTLMKSTEPFLDEYYLTDLEGTMREAGFVNVNAILTDPRHRTVKGTVPH
ncbi:hypothetical protein HHK36_003575 [Tetracentron sinense]|uniref:Methyltransferase domain-containing protein n=1 Tax=Tetracentron sinense TaxID=13715 RepID=A0A834ZY09_TETSI|nr:hypothetical protein HHK36_003575 [Tetracentron sinense]